MRKLIPALLLCLALTACAAAPTATAPPDAAGAPASTPATSAAPAGEASPFAERIKLTANITDADKQTGNALYDYFSNKFNVEMAFIPMQFGERHEKARIWVASGDVPDILWMDLNENLYTEWKSWIEGGAFQPYPQDRSRWPHIQAMFDKMIGDEMLTVGGELYALGAMQDNSDYGFIVCQQFAYRADWAEKVGKRKENDVYTWNEFFDMVKTCIEQDPGGNGPGKTYGACAPQWYFPDCFGIWQLQHKVWGTEESSYVAKDGKYVWAPAQPEFIQGLKTAKQLMEQGLIWPDNVVDSNSTMYVDLYKAGQMVAIMENQTTSRLLSMRNAMVENNPGVDRALSYQIAKVSSPVDDKDFWQKESPCYWSATSISAKATQAQLERYLDICDWILSQEGWLFRTYGLEGKDYTLSQDGSVQLLWPVNEKTGQYVDPYPAGSRGFYTRTILNGGQSALTDIAYPEEDRRDSKAAMDFDRDRATIRHLDYNLFYSSTPNKDKYGLFVEEVKAKAIEMMSASTSETIEADWQAWVDSMLPKVQPVLDDLNQLPYISTDSYEDMIAYVTSAPR